jgi:hypothetical protein
MSYIALKWRLVVTDKFWTMLTETTKYFLGNICMGSVCLFVCYCTTLSIANVAQLWLTSCKSFFWTISIACEKYIIQLLFLQWNTYKNPTAWISYIRNLCHPIHISFPSANFWKLSYAAPTFNNFVHPFYIASNRWMIDGQWIAMDFGWSSCSLIQVLFRLLPGGIQKNQEKRLQVTVSGLEPRSF